MTNQPFLIFNRFAYRRPDIIVYLSTALLLTAIVPFVQAAEFIPLGTLPGYSDSEASGVSDDGTVVVAQTYRGGYWQVFRWTDDTGPVSVGALPGDTTTVYGARGHQPLSADGSTVVGGSGEQPSGFDGPYRNSEAFRHTVEGSMISLGANTNRATGVSGDGNVVIGRSRDSNSNDSAFRWTEASGAQTLELLPNYTWSLATDVTQGGDVVVGLTGLDSRFDDQQEIFRWTEDGGTEGTGIIANGFVDPVAKVTDDGAMISSSGNVSSLANVEAFYWTHDTGVVPLGWLPVQGSMDEMHSAVRDMTPDGRVIVGWSGEPYGGRDVSPFVWTEAAGMEDFQQKLIDMHELAGALQGWHLTSINAVSSNGQFFVGYSNDNPTGEKAAWLVRLDTPWGTTVPEPNSGLLASVALVSLVLVGRFRSAP